LIGELNNATGAGNPLCPHLKSYIHLHSPKWQKRNNKTKIIKMKEK